ncbi:hypothetical protein NLU13_2502 [Sarocladium strictum]|uniref:RING-type E3 ubiquitin transferase n=1 Tax=Sarocladium strictum TaxID=5046 RepID=A0AA39L9I8_SARSR|nr:hypothetical protein NLU13_2502 [Sarocladium strictum]
MDYPNVAGHAPGLARDQASAAPDPVTQDPTPSDDRPHLTTSSKNTSALPHDSTVAICRICRGEGTPEEPLFYPCKCSGSIKYVHQECLMEWLSHSQKKYCELCKTSFRFTKLYAPDMPQTLPIHVFIQHMARYIIRNVLNWARAILAISVWVCWLPFVMRAVWSFLFWISDEGFGSGMILSRVNETAGATIELSSTILGQTVSEFLVRILLGPFKIERQSQEGPSEGNGHSRNPAVTASTLLGDVQFLRNLTPNQTINRTITTILEGQIITILVIVCFILVILVRDYVVQQQPEINMRAAFAEPENEGQPREPQPVAIIPVPAIERELHFEPVQTPSTTSGSDADTLEEDEDVLADVDGGERPDNDAISQPPSEFEDVHPTTQTLEDEGEPIVDDGAESQREAASVNDYMRIFRQASGDKTRILQIIEDEGLQEKLRYWVEITKRGSQGLESLGGPSGIRPLSSASEEDSSTAALTPSSSEQSPSVSQHDTVSENAKGKQRWEPVSPIFSVEEADSSSEPPTGPSRARAASDGPQLSSQSNPLGNNSWSFAALPAVTGPEQSPVNQELLSARREMAPSPAGVSPEPGSPDSAWTSMNEGSVPNDLADVDDISHAGPASEHSEADDLPIDEPRLAANEVGHPAIELRQPAPRPAEDNIFHRFTAQVMELMWGGLGEQQLLELAEEDIPPPAENDVADEQWVDDLVEPPLAEDADANAAELEVLAPGGNMDPEAIEDLEDFEGVMELIGMRGPLAGLFQNAIFCAVLVTVTIFACIFFPYNIGRLSIWILANPMRLARMLFEVSKLIQDATIFLAGLTSWFIINLVDMFTSPIGGQIAKHVLAIRKGSWSLWTGAGSRVLECLFLDFPTSASEIKTFSAVSHDALLTIQGHLSATLSTLSNGFGSLLAGKITTEMITSSATAAAGTVIAFAERLLDPSSFVLDFSGVEPAAVVDPALAFWPGPDRFWAIVAGYTTVFIVGAMYLRRGAQFPRGSIMQAWEAGFIETLHQASGIVKVILIISIEMLVFPLYCGLLLDAALLPLFEGATFRSRTAFTCHYPLTSIFVHWFVGTGYMFHFALFVSMCRKIMRPGVLYFIRDPDDPEFHPVRDVLERNFTTQLRKILFSAFVYGALVIVCLGGVVWGLSWSMPSVLPIHYSSNEPILEFPVDLLFYNFLMPLAVKFFKPSDGLHMMYTWWFRKCARGLHLTLFLFGERRIDEEGTLKLARDSPHQSAPFYRKLFLEISKNNEVVPKTWEDTFTGGHAKPGPRLKPRQMDILRRQKAELVESGQLVEDGYFVRAPASDRVKIPKGQRVFLPVYQSNYRKDRKPESDLYSSEQYQFVYIPPNFRVRVFLFILNIWIFAAVTGVALTIIPLMLGRTIFKFLIPEYVRTNDIYAFSIGTYILGSITYGIYHAQHIWGLALAQFSKVGDSARSGRAANQIIASLTRAMKLTYAYFCLLVLFPLLLSGLMELYVIMPMHTYMHPPSAASVQAAASNTSVEGRHTIRVMQAWTLGLLYMKLGSKLITSLFRNTRLAAAVRMILRRGWLRPDIAILTRAFVIPALVIGSVAVLAPPMAADLIIKSASLHTSGGDDVPAADAVEDPSWVARKAILHRASYPIAASVALMVRNIVMTIITLQGWSSKIRDEAYLIGERLHNFGVVSDASRRGRASWRARGARL